MSKRFPRLLLAVILLAAVALRLAGLSFGLPAIYRPDEDVLLGRAVAVAGGYADPHFFDWPSLMFYLHGGLFALARPLVRLAGGDAVCGAGDLARAWCWPAWVYLVGRLFTVAAGTATVWLVHRVGQQAYGERAGLMAAAFLAVAFLHVRDSHFATIDVPLTLATLVVLALTLRVADPRARGWAPWAGVALGLAGGIKYNAAAAGASLAVALWLRRPGPAGRRPWVRPLLVSAGLALATFLATTPFALVHPRDFAGALSYIFGHLARSATTPIGWVYLPTTVLPLAVGLPVFVLAVAGTARAVAVRSRADLILLAFLAAYVAAIGWGHFVFMRYADPLLPPLCLLAGRALADGLTALRLPARAALPLAALLLLGACADSTWRCLQFDALLGRTDTRTLAYAWVLEHLPAGSTIAMPYYAGFMHDDSAVAKNLARTRSRLSAPFVQNRPTDRFQVIEYWREEAGTWRWEDLQRQGVAYVVWGTPRPAWPVTGLLELLERQAEEIACFSPAAPSARPVVDPLDSYYLPLSEFRGVRRPGPEVRIFAIPAAPRTAAPRPPCFT
jgi:4-amino-4-deoxy-L-arabinose transferase-like glycosyltransferase